MAHPAISRSLLVCSLPIIITMITMLMAVEAEAAFKCSSSGATCDAMIDYISPNTTTLSAIKSLFNIKNLRSILGANNLPLDTPLNQSLAANQTIKIPFPCLCANGTGRSNKRPIYSVAPNDGLYHIASEVFGNLVTYQEIQAANNIKNADLIKAGQKLYIPLPCSCDQVQGQMVLHYGYIVPAGSSVDAIALQFNTSQDTLLKLNGLASPKDLLAGAVLDVPLPTCKSMVSNDSLDYPMLVPNGSAVFTAANCVMCRCDAANDWKLECRPTFMNSSLWPTCPSTQCQFSYVAGVSLISGCNLPQCAYAGYTNQTILTSESFVNSSTCQQDGPNGGAILRPKAWLWNLLLISCIVFISTCLL